MAEISPLRRRLIDDMMIRNLSPAAQQSYLYAVASFSRHFGRSPDRLGLEEVRLYQLHLIPQQRSWSHINQVICALRFFYGVTMAGSTLSNGSWPRASRRSCGGVERRRDRAVAAQTTADGAGLRPAKSPA
jgi:hypothetical protein